MFFKPLLLSVISMSCIIISSKSYAYVDKDVVSYYCNEITMNEDTKEIQNISFIHGGLKFYDESNLEVGNWKDGYKVKIDAFKKFKVIVNLYQHKIDSIRITDKTTGVTAIGSVFTDMISEYNKNKSSEVVKFYTRPTLVLLDSNNHSITTADLSTLGSKDHIPFAAIPDNEAKIIVGSNGAGQFQLTVLLNNRGVACGARELP